VPSPAQPVASTGAVREAIDPSRFPWIRPLGHEYVHHHDRVAALFAGNPAEPSAWRDTIARVSRSTRDRQTLVATLEAQLTRRGASHEAHEAVSRLNAPASVAIVTGQQAGVFGGPLYTVLKAVTTIQLARQVRADYDVDAVPVFWVDAEDHDWAEVRSARILDRDGNAAGVTVADMAGAGSQPVGALTFDDAIAAATSRLAALLPPTEFTREVMDAAARRYRPGQRVGTAFAGWIEDLLGRHGLVVFESDDPAVKPLAADLFAKEIDQRATARLASEAGRVLAGLGHPPQVETADDGVALFYLDERGRRAIKTRNSQYQIGDREVSAAELRAEVLHHPERFSPNVLLRPLVQDRLFPTVCYVAGPAELAYQAQLGGVYRAYGIESPLLYARATATLVDSGAVRFLERSQLPLEALQVRDDAALNRLLESQLPPGLEAAISEADRVVRERVLALKAAVVPLDPTLAGAVDTTLERMHDTLKTLQAKVIQAAKRKDDTLRRQFLRTRALAFPDGVPQERSLSVIFFANRYGMALGDRLVETLPLATDKHYVLSL